MRVSPQEYPTIIIQSPHDVALDVGSARFVLGATASRDRAMTEPLRESSASGKQITYVADPMCSWCWGFAPVISAINAAYGGEIPIKVVLGGLRAGETRAMDDKLKAYIRHHWETVREKTGQPFTFDFFEREGFVYDTEPACRAVVAARNLRPDARLDCFEAVQRSFYLENRDVTDQETLVDIASSVGIDPSAFELVFNAPEILEATRSDFALSHALGIAGFPAVVLKDDVDLAFLTVGYQPFQSLKPHLDLWLRA